MGTRAWRRARARAVVVALGRRTAVLVAGGCGRRARRPTCLVGSVSRPPQSSAVRRDRRPSARQHSEFRHDDDRARSRLVARGRLWRRRERRGVRHLGGGDRCLTRRRGGAALRSSLSTEVVATQIHDNEKVQEAMMEDWDTMNKNSAIDTWIRNPRQQRKIKEVVQRSVSPRLVSSRLVSSRFVPSRHPLSRLVSRRPLPTSLPLALSSRGRCSMLAKQARRRSARNGRARERDATRQRRT